MLSSVSLCHGLKDAGKELLPVRCHGWRPGVLPEESALPVFRCEDAPVEDGEYPDDSLSMP